MKILTLDFLRNLCSIWFDKLTTSGKEKIKPFVLSQSKDTNGFGISLFILFILINIVSNLYSELENLNVLKFRPETYTYNIVNPTNPKFNGEFNVSKELIKDGDIFFDVGAFVGDYTFEIINKFKNLKVFTFEPVRNHFNEILNKFNIEVSELMRFDFNFKNNFIHLINKAISNFNGTSKFYYYEKHGSVSGLYHYDGYDKLSNSEQINVNVLTLDTFCFLNKIKKINYLKVDTEGGDYFVLLGALKLLNQQEIDYIQFEYTGAYRASRTTLKETFKLLTKYNYKVFRIMPHSLIHISHWKNILENYRYSNFLAVSSKKDSKYSLVNFN